MLDFSYKKWTGSDTDGTKKTIDPLAMNKNTIVNGIDYDSSAIQSVKFDPATENAKIQYTSSNQEYDFPMTKEEFQQMKLSGSKGQWTAYEARRY